MPRRHQPVRQDSEGFPARSANPTTHPDAVVLVVVRLPESPPVADYRLLPAQRAQPRQEIQWNYPGSMLSLVSSSAIKRITAGVKARRRPSPAKFRSAGWAFTLPAKVGSNEKRIPFSNASRLDSVLTIGRLFSATRSKLDPDSTVKSPSSHFDGKRKITGQC